MSGAERGCDPGSRGRRTPRVLRFNITQGTGCLPDHRLTHFDTGYTDETHRLMSPKVIIFRGDHPINQSSELKLVLNNAMRVPRSRAQPAKDESLIRRGSDTHA